MALALLQDNICFAKTHDEAKIPSRRIEDGLYDLYACFDEVEMRIEPNEIKMIPTGIASVFTSKYRVAFRERGTNTKSGLIVMAGQIDSGYRGEYFVALYNTNKFPVIISKNIDNVIKGHNSRGIRGRYLLFPYDKAICQFAVEHVPQVGIKEIPYEELVRHKSERMFGKLGSSNK